MSIVAKDGNSVEPVTVDNFVIAVAERYDAIITLKHDGAFKIDAAALGQVGGASALINCGAQKMPSNDGFEKPKWGSRQLAYSQLRAIGPTTLPAGEQVSFDLNLEGDMNDYRWSINGEYYPDAAPYLIKRGQIVNINFINKTKMAHPMHLHGHFFRYLKLNGDNIYAPLMDTVNVPAFGTTHIQFYADHPGSWICHCHILYHLDRGMARLFEFEA